VSHQPERKEKNCLNCGTIVNGRYCHVCGQENIVTKQSFWGLALHFIYDVFHFDGKFFDTLRYLLFRPGKVPKEYVAGKRGKYLDPIRMYLFTSAVFFLVFFSVKDVSKILDSNMDWQMSRAERLAAASGVHSQLQKQPSDPLLQYKLGLLLDTTKAVSLQKADSNFKNDSFLISLPAGQYILRPEKESLELDTVKKENDWVGRKVEKKWEERKAKSGDDDRKLLSDSLSEFLHKLPYLLFLSLPFFALILKLLYIRRKNVFYSDHAVFTLYHYIFSFILLLLYLGFDALYKSLHWAPFNWVITLLMFSWPLYLYFGMKRFYQQGWSKTLGKFLLVNTLGFITLIFLFVIFLIVSFAF
jgi:hypothetical protein